MNLPNKLTIARIIMVPFFIAAFMTGYYPAALVLFCAASVTALNCSSRMDGRRPPWLTPQKRIQKKSPWRR